MLKELQKIKQELNEKKRDSENYQRFVSEGFYFGFQLWAKFIAVLRFW